MKILVSFLLAAAFAFPATVQISDKLATAQGGAQAPSSIKIEWPSFTEPDSTFVPASSTTVSVAADGSFTVSLYPNDVATPSNTYYTVTYYTANSTSVTTAKWLVPTTTSVLKIAQVQQSRPLPLPNYTVQLSQLTCGTCSVGDIPEYNGNVFVASQIPRPVPTLPGTCRVGQLATLGPQAHITK
jgi:hypothetical protein